MTLLYWAIIGLFFGSFANVYFYRIPRDLSVVLPNSFCPECRNPIAWRDNIPIVSYLLLKGRCRSCRTRISPRYPLIEFLVSALFVSVAFRFRNEPTSALAAFTLFSFINFLIGGVDIVTYFRTERSYGIIPDHLVVILAASGLIYTPMNPLIAPAFWMGPVSALVAGVSMLLFRWAANRVYKTESLGLGDVKLVAAVGLWVGWEGVLAMLIIGSLVGSALGLIMIRAGKIKWHAALPYGPFLALGSLIAIFISG